MYYIIKDNETLKAQSLDDAVEIYANIYKSSKKLIIKDNNGRIIAVKATKED